MSLTSKPCLDGYNFRISYRIRSCMPLDQREIYLNKINEIAI
jgi:hypothetical protein